ncbi:LOG family protein, partial [Chloroflexota bacterium]
ELTEVLTLIQTHKIKPFPVVLFNSHYWKGFLDWLQKSALDKGFISEEDFNLLRVCDEPEAVIEAVKSWYKEGQVIGTKALSK